MKKIHFVLPGGGVKGCFQAGFLYYLTTKYGHLFEIHQVDATSVGSLNGYAFVTRNVEKLKDTWFSIKEMSDLFPSTYYFRLLQLWYGFKGLGMCHNHLLLNKIEQYPVSDPEQLKQFNCVVQDVTDGQSYYINGSNPKIKEYVLASSSPWIITPPQKIDDRLYTDGGLLENFPIAYCDTSHADLKVMVGYDPTYELLPTDIGDNLFTLLQSLIDIARRAHYQEITRKIKELDLIIIPYAIQTDFLNFDQDLIKKGFQLGELHADEFAQRYLLSDRTDHPVPD